MMADMEPMETVETVERERLNPFVLPDTARRVKIACATRGMTQGELIDEFAAQHLPPVPPIPGAEAAR
jgi:hypothetical protein